MTDSNDGTSPTSATGNEFAFEADASFAQRRLWFLDQLEPGNPAYNISVALRLRGPLQVEALQQALDKLVARHETLRTTFDRVGGVPMQVVADHGQVHVNLVALTLPLEAQLRELTRQPFDLRHGPLLRVTLLRLGPAEHVLLLVIHHIVADAWSLDILHRELAAAYSAALTGTAANCDELTVQYADYAEWQQDWLRGAELERQLNYWRKRLVGAPAVLNLPTDRPRPRVQSHAGAHLQRLLRPDVAAAARELAQQHGCTLFHLYLSAYAVLLGRWAATDDLVIGTPIAGRQRAQLEPLIGFFVNTLAMRVELDDDPAFTVLLRRIRDASIGAYAHQDLPFEKLVEALEPSRSASYTPLFQALFVLNHSADSNASFGDLQAEGLLVESGTAKFDLTLFVSAATAETSLLLEYNTDLFEATTIERMLGHLERLLDEIVARPDCVISRLPLLMDSEQTRILQVFNHTNTAFASASVQQLVEQQVARTPDTAAVSDATTTLTYRELNARANCLARSLQELGANGGNRIAICLQRSVDMAVAVLAVLKSGAAYVPVDPAYPAARIARMLRDAQPVAAIAEAATAHVLPSEFNSLCLDGYDWQSQDAGNLNCGGDIAYVIYTSGSSGEPKGVEMTQAALSNLVQWQNSQPDLAEPARTLQFASLSFDVSFQEFFSTWAQGGCIIMLDEATRRDMPALARHIVDADIERLYLPFAALQPLADALLAAETLPQGLRDVIVAGEALQLTPTLRALFSRLGEARLHNQYGPSETHVVTAYTLTGDPAMWPALPPIGTPVANTRAYVLDRHRQVAPIGVPGELYIGGVQLARGYLQRPDLTAERFVAAPSVLAPGQRLYRTGDQARWLANGQLEFLGRTDEQLKWRGYRIEPGEIEATLMRHPGVLQSAVVLRADTPGDPRLIAYVVAHTADMDHHALREHLRSELPEYMLPSLFISLPELPLTASGKLARRELPLPDFSDAASDYVGPRTPIEVTLVQLWGDILDVPQVGIHDDFFKLGGHSLLATQLISRVRDALGIDVPLIELFDKPSVAEFAAALEGTSAIGVAAIPRADRTKALPLSFAQQRLWFLDQLEPGSKAYNFPVALELSGALDADCLERALATLAARHEILRTVFVGSANAAEQRILAKASVTLQRGDISAAADVQQAELQRLSSTPFDLTRGPLLRAHLLRVADREAQILLLVMHHIITDGWSLDIMLTELASLYGGERRGERPQLQELPLQYADYASWQRGSLQGPALEQQMSYWRDTLANVPPVLELPLDFPRPGEQTYNGRSVLTVMPATLLKQLRALAQEQHCTLYMLLLAAFDVLLAAYADTTELVVGTPIAGRQRSELEGLIGYFSNTLVIPAQLGSDPNFDAFLRRVKQATLAAYAHQDLPFEKLVEELQPQRSLSHTPIFQVMFVLQNAPSSALEFDSTQARGIDFEMGIAKFDLLLEMAETQHGLRAGLQYNSDLFAATSVERMLTHLQTLLHAIVARPQARLSELSLLSDNDRRTALQAFAMPPIELPTTRVQCLFERQAEQNPAQVAVEMAGTTLSYAELNARANSLAHHLRAQAVGPGSRIGICLERSLILAVGVLAILKTGAAYVPLDPRYPARRVRAMLADAHVEVVLTQTALRDTLPTNVRTVLLDSCDELFDGASADMRNPPAAGDAAYVIFTSGSSGRPKGVEQTHAGLSNLVQWQCRQPGLDRPARTLQFASLSFDVSFQELFSTWAQGGTVVLLSEDERRDFAALSRLLATACIERLFLPSAAMQPLARAALETASELRLRDVIVAGEQLTVTPAVRALFQALPGARLHNHYGPTETHVVSAHTLGADPAQWPVLPPIGRPVANTSLYVLNQQQQPVPAGIPGELYVAGVQVARGYIAAAEIDAKRFSHNPFGPGGERMYRTGDRIRINDAGELEYCGRNDGQLKWRGYRIEPGEIEAALLTHRGVQQALVVLREDHPGDPRLVAYVVPIKASIDPKALEQFLAARLPDYMLPRPVIMLAELPRTPSGKLARSALPAPEYHDHKVSHTEPRSDLEAKLTASWAEVLKLERVGIHDDFFQLGGHSLLATQLMSRIRDALGFAPPLKNVFSHPTPAMLAQRIETLLMAAELQTPTDTVVADDREQFDL